jgi:hypothetical protein
VKTSIIPFNIRQGVEILANALETEELDHVKSGIIWALGQIGKHSSEHSKALAINNIFHKIIKVFFMFL